MSHQHKDITLAFLHQTKVAVEQERDAMGTCPNFGVDKVQWQERNKALLKQLDALVVTIETVTRQR